MKNSIKYIALLLLVTFFSSCDDDSIQQRRDKEKAERLKYIADNDIPDSARQQSGLYYISMKEGEGDSIEPGKTYKVYVFYAFYHLDGTLIKQEGLTGKIEPFSFDYSYNAGVKQAFIEAVAKMKEGGKARLIIPSSLNNGMPYTGVEIMSTNEFFTVICDLELSEIRESQDPDTEF